MTTERQLRKHYGTTRRRVMLCADKQTESFILEAQERLTELTGAKPSLSVAMTYLIKEGHNLKPRTQGVNPMDTKARFEDLKAMIFITLWSGPNGEQFLVNTLKENNTYFVLIGTHLEDRLPNLDHVFECGRIWPNDVPKGWTMTEIDNPFVYTAVYNAINKERWPAEVAEILKETAE